jgi:hypothetical protein
MNHRISRISVIPLLAALAATAPLAQDFGALTVQMGGRVLEKNSGRPVAGASVRMKGHALPVALTDSLGRFTLSGNLASLAPPKLEWNVPLLDEGLLRVRTFSENLVVEAEVFDAEGKRLGESVHRLRGTGEHVLPVLGNVQPAAAGFLKVRAGDELYRFRIVRENNGRLAAVHTPAIPTNGILARVLGSSDMSHVLTSLELGRLFGVPEKSDSIEVAIAGIVAHRSAAPFNGELGDIMLSSPLCDLTGCGRREAAVLKDPDDF